MVGAGKNPLGIMQGRLLPPVGGRIQAFPSEGWEREFPIAAELGLDCIEFIFDGDPSSHPLMNADGLNKIERLQRETGVSVLTVCADYFMDHPLHKGPEDSAKASLRMLAPLIANASKIGATEIVIPCVDQSNIRGRAESDRFVYALGQCLGEAEARRVNLSLETDLNPADFIELLLQFSSERVTVNYDSGNSASLGYNPREELSSYAGSISDVHIKDRLRGGGTVPLGEGDTDFGTLFKMLKSSGYGGPYILQAARRPGMPEKETVWGYIEFVKGYIER